MRSELSQYKRRAQIALRKAQEEASRAVEAKCGEQDELVSELQTELASMIRSRDSLLETLEKIKIENAAIVMSRDQKILEMERVVSEKEAIFSGRRRHRKK